jgi:hypothetical protein
MAFESFAEIKRVVPGGPASALRRDEFNQFNNTSATAKACATNWSGKNNRVAPKQRHGLAPRPASSAPPETSSIPRSSEPPGAPGDSSAGCVSGSSIMLPGAIPSPA